MNEPTSPVLSDALCREINEASRQAVDRALAAVVLDHARPAPLSRCDRREWIKAVATEAAGPLLNLREVIAPEQVAEVAGRMLFMVLATLLERSLDGFEYLAALKPAEPTT